MIGRMMGKGQVWFAPMRDIARHVRQCMRDGTWKPRVERHGPEQARAGGAPARA
jgi:hypothetical protein